MLFEWNPSAARRTISLVTRKSRRRHPLSGMKAQIPNLIENLLTRWNPIQQNMGINTSKISISIISINISRLQECATKYQRRLEKRHGPRSETWPLERNKAPGAKHGTRSETRPPERNMAPGAKQGPWSETRLLEPDKASGLRSLCTTGGAVSCFTGADPGSTVANMFGRV